MSIALGKNITDFADYLSDTVFLVDTAGKIQYVNAACEGVLGYKPRDMTGEFIIDLVMPEDRDKTRREAKQVMAAMAGNKRIGFENRYRHQNASPVHLMWSAGWLESEQLRIGIARDVTPLRQKSILDRGLAHASVPLAAHERRVLELLLTDASEKQIADRLGLAITTTHSYVTGIFRKFGVRGRAGLMALWIGNLSKY